MPFVLTRAVKGGPDESPRRLGEYSSATEAALALATALRSYPEYGSDPEAQCWWAIDKLGRAYRFNVTERSNSRERSNGLARAIMGLHRSEVSHFTPGADSLFSTDPHVHHKKVDLDYLHPMRGSGWLYSCIAEYH